MKYNILNAVAYEVTVMLVDFDARWMNNKIIKMIRAYCFVDWCDWKTEQTMEEVDAQVEALHMLWDREADAQVEALHMLWEREDDDWRDVFTEEDPDTGTVLGYTFEIKGNWDKTEDD